MRNVLLSLCGIIILVGCNATEPGQATPLETNEHIPAPEIDASEFQDPYQVACIAKNIYFEAKGEPLEGQIAVAHVVINRTNSSAYPNTPCEVVYQARLSRWGLENGKVIPLRNQCQFSWYCDGKSDVIRDWNRYREFVSIAHDALSGEIPDNTNGALWYHANYVDPYWNRNMQLVAYHGVHKFYTKNY